MVQRMKKAHVGVLLLFLAVVTGAAGASPARAEEGGYAVGEVVEHRVLKGDDLTLLAAYYYGDPRQWKRIYGINRDRLSDPLLIHPGEILKVKVDRAHPLTMTYSDFLGRVFR